MLKPLVKYPGGKERELKYIIPNLPKNINNYYEPFVGGGAVYFALHEKADKSLINDKSSDLILLYKAVQTQNRDFINFIKKIGTIWNQVGKFAFQISPDLWKKFNDKHTLKIDCENINLNNAISLFNGKDIINKYIIECLTRKINYLYKQKNKGKIIKEDGFFDIIETAFKSAVYMYYRNMYNTFYPKYSWGIRAALYLFIRQYAYSSMFRFSKSGKFNVPYGGKSYNHINIKDKLKYFSNPELLNLLSNTSIENMDFEDFLNKNKPHKSDFLFIDPPYDSDFSKYDNLSFDISEQKRLANFLINQIEANWMIVIKDTELIRSIYPNGKNTANNNRIYINDFKKSYNVNFKNRNLKKSQHLIITNYPT